MLKTKLKIFLAILLVLLLITSYCLATEAPATSEEVNTTGTSTISDENNGSEDSVTADENSLTDAQSTTVDEEYDVASEEQAEEPNWFNSDLFQIEDTVNMNAVVDGNAFIIGKDVTISGEVGGDLFVIANKLTIDGGYVYSSIFAIANEITINGSIYDLYAKCNTFNLETNGSIYRDIKLDATNVNISGKIKRNAYISTNTLNIVEDAGQLISGNLNYSSNQEATIPQDTVAGEINFTKSVPTESSRKSVASYIVDFAKTIIFTLVVALLLFWLAPKFVEKIRNTSGSRVFAALGIGIISPICIGIACIILLVSIVALPISISLALVYLILAIAGKSITSIYLGNLLTNKMKAEGNKKIILFTLLSSAILWVINLIPVLGSIVGFIATLLGIGLVIINLFRKKEITE